MDKIIKPGSEKVSQSGSIRSVETLEGFLHIEFNGYNTTELLPQGFSLVKSKNMECDHVRRQVEVNLDKIDSKDFIFSLLHEIGHANVDLDADKETESHIIAQLEILGSTPEDDTRYTEIFTEWVNIIERKERNAWIYSLKTSIGKIDPKQFFESFDSFQTTVLRRYNSYRTGMKYVYERSGRGTDSQWQQSDAYVDKVFDEHVGELIQVLKNTWDLSS